MTDYTSQIDAWYEAIQYRAPPASELASLNAQLQTGILTTAQAINQIEVAPYTLNYVDPVIREYQAAFNRVPDQAGVAYWVDQFAANPTALANLSVIFANSAEFTTRYGATATTPASPTLVTALYENILGRAPDQAGLQYWSTQNLDAAQLLQAFAQSAEYITDTNAQVIAFQNLEVLGTEPTTGSLFAVPVAGGVTTYTVELGQSAVDYTITGPLGTVTGVLTSGSGLAPITGGSNVVINAPYGLNDFQSINLSGTSNVLNANYGPGANFNQSGLNIQGVQTWNIQAAFNGSSAGDSYGSGSGSGSGTVPSSIISFTGDASQGNVITGLTTVNFNDNSGADSLYIGDNAEPVDSTTPANGFAINVSNAVGNGSNGVDVDIAAQEFTGKDTINVSAYIVGGFPELGGSYVIPAFETGSYNNDKDTYNPNWLGFQKDAFAIASGASAGPNGAIGFQTWDISSAGAASVGTINILALGNEGSSTATTINLSNPAGDNSATILFATAISDSTSADWQNLTTINLSGTTGNVVLTGAETDAQESGSFFSNGGGGLLTSDTSALTSIVGGAGNSFYDLSSLSLAAASTASIDGGHGAHGNSEVAFSNYVVATATVSSGGNVILLNTGTVVNLTHIEVLDDTGGLNGTDLQGGAIDLNDFNLTTLQANYDLLSGPLGNLFSISGGSIIQNAAFGAGTDVAPVGYELLQLLNADGSTANTLGANLSIWGGDANLAVNMIDVADGAIASTNIYRDQEVAVLNHYDAAYVAANNVITVDTNIWNLYSAPLALTGYDISISQGGGGLVNPLVNTNSTLKLWLSDDGVKVDNTAGVQIGSIFDASDVHINAYTTSDIYLPYESVGANNPQGDVAQQNFVVLGSELPGIATDGVGGFIVSPVNTAPAFNTQFGTVNFYDNTVDTGGSPPGGADNLVLGYTNFTADLAPVSTEAFFDPTGTIGYASVEILSLSGTGIFDYGHGSLEIGAAAVTVLNAATTSHLIMDLPAVPLGAESFGGGLAATGITVQGSLTGQNLIQGSSYVVDFDTNGHTAPASSGGATGTTGVLEGPDGGTAVQDNFGVGNDILTGGTGLGLGAFYAWGEGGNTGDNYFPEGGNDAVNLAHGSTGYDTVWVAQYDVSSLITAAGVAPHYVFGQAVTDIVNGVETYVDGYGPGVTASGVSPTGGAVGPTGSNSLLTINGFIEGNNTTQGDILVLDPQDWAVGALHNGTFDRGLVNTSGVEASLLTGGVPHLATTVYVGTSASDGGFILGGFDVILDGLAGYQNASQLAQALSNADGGDIGFFVPIAGKTTEHLLIAYNNTVKGGVTIDDVTITNTNAFGAIATSQAGVHVSAVDILQIDGGTANPVATVGSLLHNIDLFHA